MQCRVGCAMGTFLCSINSCGDFNDFPLSTHSADLQFLCVDKNDWTNEYWTLRTACTMYECWKHCGYQSFLKRNGWILRRWTANFSWPCWGQILKPRAKLPAAGSNGVFVPHSVRVKCDTNISVGWVMFWELFWGSHRSASGHLILNKHKCLAGNNGGMTIFHQILRE